MSFLNRVWTLPDGHTRETDLPRSFDASLDGSRKIAQTPLGTPRAQVARQTQGMDSLVNDDQALTWKYLAHSAGADAPRQSPAARAVCRERLSSVGR